MSRFETNGNFGTDLWNRFIFASHPQSVPSDFYCSLYCLLRPVCDFFYLSVNTCYFGDFNNGGNFLVSGVIGSFQQIPGTDSGIILQACN